MQRFALLALALGACTTAGSGGGEGDGSTGAASTTTATDSGAMSTGGASTGPDATTRSDASEGSESSGSTGGDPTPMFEPLCEGGLPYAIDRTPAGDPVDAGELTAITQQYLDLLTHLDYFDLMAERAHGWPEDDPRGRYWYETWWSGVDIVKSGGAITFLHNETGADNNGLRTGPLLEGVCYALALWDRPEDERLVRGFMRGFIAWMRAMERSADDPDAPMLSRAFYPESTVDELGFAIDYSLNRPGEDADPSEYVHVPDNPHWGDIWIKNKRSKDDIGHMLRAIAQLSACEAVLGDGRARGVRGAARRSTPRGRARSKTTAGTWRRWTRTASSGCPTISWRTSCCRATPSVTRCSRCGCWGAGIAGELDCGNGIGDLDPLIIGSNDHNGNILRSFHEAAANNALITGNDAEAEAAQRRPAARDSRRPSMGTTGSATRSRSSRRRTRSTC